MHSFKNFLLITSLLFSLSSASAYACSCFEQRPIAEEFLQARTVALVEITKKTLKDYTPDDSERLNEWYVYTARVIRGFKGALQRTIRFQSAANSAMCGVSMSVGKRYVIWEQSVSGEEDQSSLPEIVLCSRTKPASLASKDLAWLYRNAR